MVLFQICAAIKYSEEGFYGFCLAGFDFAERVIAKANSKLGIHRNYSDGHRRA